MVVAVVLFILFCLMKIEGSMELPGFIVAIVIALLMLAIPERLFLSKQLMQMNCELMKLNREIKKLCR